MTKSRWSTNKLQMLLVVSCILSAICGVGALAKAASHETGIKQIESQLYQQAQQLSIIEENWSSQVREQIEFVITKIQLSQMVLSLASANTHLAHACEAIKNERKMLIAAQDQHARPAELIETLIESTFDHSKALGCMP